MVPKHWQSLGWSGPIVPNAKNELTIEGLSVWNERCCKVNDSINLIKEMIDVRDEFKEFQGFSREALEF